MKTDATYLGAVRRVVGAKVLVEISPDIPSASPIIHGHVHRLGQVGSFVRIPLGYLNVYGVVSMVGASELAQPEESEVLISRGQRWIEIQLVGESYGHEGFQRGVSLLPTLDDEVHAVTEDDLAVIYGRQDRAQIAIGHHSASESLVATVDLDKIVTRHVAIVGSTGSGKSNTVAGLLKALAQETYPSARVVVIDPHGEYGAAFKDTSRVFRIGDPTYPLYVPYWALSFDELMWFLVERKTASESLQDAAIRDYIFEEKKKNAADLKAGSVEPTEITVDSPVPFDLRALWYHFDRSERMTYKDSDRTQEALIKEGNAAALTPAQFEPAAMGSKAPFKPNMSLGMGPYLHKVLGRLKDKRFGFLTSPGDYDLAPKKWTLR